MTKQNRSSSRVAVVTGAAMGIGEAIATRLAEDGHTVVLADLHLGAAEEAARRIASWGWRAEAIGVDVGKPESIEEAFRTIGERHGRCDILVNNAGVAKTYSFMDFPLENWLLTMNVNVTGAMLCAQHAARSMVRSEWGRIVNIASVSGLRASLGRTAYGTSKAAVMGLTRQMAVELASYGITANAVAPGPVDTPMTKTLHSEESRRQYGRAVPAGRYGRPEEIASAVAYLVSDDAAYINGHVLPVDGGYVAAGLMEI
jgi:NAD(P)-dependent dehydrogenase (short-subunit alcohol dehydrogenase family)